MTKFFVGVILIAIVSKVAERSVAVKTAMMNKTGLASGIAVGSSPQIDLLISPFLLFSSYLLG